MINDEEVSVVANATGLRSATMGWGYDPTLLQKAATFVLSRGVM